MTEENFKLIEMIESISSSFKDVREFVSAKASSISSILNRSDRAYKVVTDWSIDLVQDPMLIYITIYIDVDRKRAFVGKLYAKDLDKSIDTEALISKCDSAYKTYFTN